MGSRRRGEDRKKWSFSLCVCLVCGNCPRHGVGRMPSLFPVRNRPSKAAAVCVTARFWDCSVRAHQRSTLTFSGAPNPSAPLFACVGRRLTHHHCYRRSKADVTMERSAGRGIQVGTGERAEQIQRGTERGGGGEPRGDRRHFHISRLPDPSLCSLSLSFLSCASRSPSLPLSLSVRRSFALLSSLSLHNLSLPAAIPTTFSGVTQQKEEGSSLTVAGAVI